MYVLVSGKNKTTTNKQKQTKQTTRETFSTFSAHSLLDILQAEREPSTRILDWTVNLGVHFVIECQVRVSPENVWFAMKCHINLQRKSRLFGLARAGTIDIFWYRHANGWVKLTALLRSSLRGNLFHLPLPLLVLKWRNRTLRPERGPPSSHEGYY